MKYLLLCFWIFATSYAVHAQQSITDMLTELDQTILKAPSYDKKKLERIAALKELFNEADNDNPLTRFEIYRKIFEEYKLFRYDSAYITAKALEATAQQLDDTAKLTFARLKLSFCLLSAGLYKEATESLASVHVQHLPDTNRAEYYALLGRYYFDVGDFDDDLHHTPTYIIKGNSYLDSALALFKPGTFAQYYFSGLKQLKAGNDKHALINFHKLLDGNELTPHQVALTASTAADVYSRLGNSEDAIRLLIKAVIGDIQSSTKETSASFNLASILYKQGDVKNASTCIDLAMKDADFYGARQRKLKVSNVLPLIEGEKLNKAENQKRIWTTYAVLVTLLLIAVVVSVSVILNQLKKLKSAQKTITEAHLKEQEINNNLAEANNKLTEANKIKEEYLGYFFSVNSEFFDKIERFKNSVEQKIAERKNDDIRFLVSNINLRKEKEYLVQNFDRVFLKLFPHFISEFNSLFNEENRILLKEDELLNTDLRIFALIRMGIQDSEKIARILQYSVNTINSYKTKIKNRSIVSNEEFERRIMEIKSA